MRFPLRRGQSPAPHRVSRALASALVSGALALSVLGSGVAGAIPNASAAALAHQAAQIASRTHVTPFDGCPGGGGPCP